MSSRLRLSVGSVAAVALAYQAVSGSSSATAQTANRPTGQTATSPNLPSINVQAPAPKGANLHGPPAYLPRPQHRGQHRQPRHRNCNRLRRLLVWA
jgi:hypothetical protein